MMDTKKRNTIFCIVTVMLSVFWFQNAFGYQINLNKQLNLISLPEQPANTAIDQLTSSIAGKFNSIWAYVGGSWKLYNPGDPNFSDLLTMEAGRGYWIDMKESGTLSGTGTAAPSSIPLSTGWNLVGYNCGSLEISNALASIQGKYDSVWAFKEGVWKLYDPANPNFSDLTTMDPGFGYWIDAKESTTWTCPDDYTPRPTVPGSTTPESSGQVTVTKTSNGVNLSDGTEMNFQGLGDGSSVAVTLERASNTIDMGTSSIATSGSMRILTVDAVAYNGTDESSTFAPILTIPKEEIGSLNVNYVNILRVSIDPETGLEERFFFPALQDQTGNLTFRDWLLPLDILEEQVKSVQKMDSFKSSKATGPKIIKYSPITIQNEGNVEVSAQLVRMRLTKGTDGNYDGKRIPISRLSETDRQKELKKPIQNVVIFVHGHNEAEKTGFEPRTSEQPWLYDYKKIVWNYMYETFVNKDFSDREGSTVFYEFIYPSWRSIYKHLNAELARQVKEALAPQLKNGMRFNLFIVAHSMGGLVSRSGLMLFEEQLKDNLQRLVTWGTPHHGSPLNTLMFCLLSPALASKQNTLSTKAVRYFGAEQTAPTQDMLDFRWTSGDLGQEEGLQLDKIFRWYGAGTDPKAWEKWNTSSGTMLYNEDLYRLNLFDDNGDKYTFLYGITNENLKLKDWSEFGPINLAYFKFSMSDIGKGATLVYLLTGNPIKQFMGADLGDSDGSSPVISMAGYQIKNATARYIGAVDHEQYFNNPVFGPDTADETYKAMDFSNKKYDCPEIKLTSPTTGQTFKANEKISVVGKLIWPGDDKPGTRIKQIQVKSSSSGKSIILSGATKKDDGNFSGEFKAGDLGNNQDVAASDLTFVLQFKDDTELETQPCKGVNFGMKSKFEYDGGQFEFNPVGNLEARGVSIESDTVKYDHSRRYPGKGFFPGEHVGIAISVPPHEPGDLVRVRWIPNISCTNCDSEEFKRCDDFGICHKLRVNFIGHDVNLCAGCGSYLEPEKDMCLYRGIKVNSPVDMEVTPPPPKGSCYDYHILFKVYTSICTHIYREDLGDENGWYSGGCDSWTSVELGW
jgi:hypothetical protein